MLWIRLGTRMQFRRTAVVETWPPGILCNFTTKPDIYTKKFETFLGPAWELEIFGWLLPFWSIFGG